MQLCLYVVYTFNREKSYSSCSNKYISINFSTHNEYIKLIEYCPRTNISFNNFQVFNHAGLEANLCSTKGFCGQIRDRKCHHIMSIFNINNNKFLTNIIKCFACNNRRNYIKFKACT